MAASIPNLPGFRSNRHGSRSMTQSFSMVNGVQIIVPGDAASTKMPEVDRWEGKGVAGSRQRAAAELAAERREKSRTHPILKFDAFFTESVLDSAREDSRVRPCAIQFFLEDDTIMVTEPTIANSGIPSGTFLKRMRVRKGRDESLSIGTVASGLRTSPGDFFSVNDFALGSVVELCGRSMTIIDADPHTREYLGIQRGVEFGRAIAMPVDAHSAAAAAAAAAKNKKTGMSEMKRYMESSRGRAVDATKNLDRFIAFDRKVLSFEAVWDDSERLYGDLRFYTVNFFLSDETVQVTENHEANSGRDHFPALVSRQKLPKARTRGSAPGGAPADSVYTERDLAIGQYVNVFGRRLLLTSCDRFTQNYYTEKYGMGDESFAPIQVDRQERAMPTPTLTEFQGGVVTFGSELDSLQSCLRLRPAVGKKDGVKAALNSGKVLRFEAVMISDRPEDATRRFVVCFELADDTVAVFEAKIRNSGIWGGKFLERVPLKNEATGKGFVPQDFKVGQEMTINAYRFLLTGTDQYTIKYMQARPDEFPDMATGDGAASKEDDGSSSADDRTRVLAMTAMKNLAQSFNRRRHQVNAIFAKFDKNLDGNLDVNHFERALHALAKYTDPQMGGLSTDDVAAITAWFFPAGVRCVDYTTFVGMAWKMIESDSRK